MITPILAFFFDFEASASSAAPAVDDVQAGGGGSRKRRIMLDGVVYNVTPEQERQILQAYIDSKREQLAAAPEPQKAKLRTRIKRARNRIEKADTRAERLRRLLMEDEEILVLMTLH